MYWAETRILGVEKKNEHTLKILKLNNSETLARNPHNERVQGWKGYRAPLDQPGTLDSGEQ